MYGQPTFRGARKEARVSGGLKSVGRPTDRSQVCCNTNQQFVGSMLELKRKKIRLRITPSLQKNIKIAIALILSA